MAETALILMAVGAAASAGTTAYSVYSQSQAAADAAKAQADAADKAYQQMLFEPGQAQGADIRAQMQPSSIFAAQPVSLLAQAPKSNYSRRMLLGG